MGEGRGGAGEAGEAGEDSIRKYFRLDVGLDSVL